MSSYTARYYARVQTFLEQTIAGMQAVDLQSLKRDHVSLICRVKVPYLFLKYHCFPSLFLLLPLIGIKAVTFSRLRLVFDVFWYSFTCYLSTRLTC